MFFSPIFTQVRGRLTTDPEVKTANNANCVNIDIAVTVGAGDKKHSEYIEATFWGRDADLIAKYPKGTKVLIAGEEELRVWVDNNNTPHAKRKIKVMLISSIENPNSQGNQSNGYQTQQPQGGYAPQNNGGYNQPQGNIPAGNVPQQGNVPSGNYGNNQRGYQQNQQQPPQQQPRPQNNGYNQQGNNANYSQQKGYSAQGNNRVNNNGGYNNQQTNSYNNTYNNQPTNVPPTRPTNEYTSNGFPYSGTTPDGDLPFN